MLTNWEGRAFVIRGENHFATSNAPSAFTRMTFSKLEGVMSESLFSGRDPLRAVRRQHLLCGQRCEQLLLLPKQHSPQESLTLHPMRLIQAVFVFLAIR